MNIIRGDRKNAEAEPADGVGSATVGRRGAMNDLREGLGPELAGFEIEALNPKRLARKHLLGDVNADQAAQRQPAANGTPLTPGEHPPSGPDVTDLHGADEARQGDRPRGPGRGDREDGISPVRQEDL
jgi:hypothetical protein